MVDPGEGKIRLQKIKMNKDRSKSTNDHAPGGPFAYICLFQDGWDLNRISMDLVTTCQTNAA